MSKLGQKDGCLLWSTIRTERVLQVDGDLLCEILAGYFKKQNIPNNATLTFIGNDRSHSINNHFPITITWEELEETTK
jgi:hypothetical protein